MVGGQRERLVSCVKRCLKKAISNVVIDYIELQTVVQEIEDILNNRPLCAVCEDDLDDVLTPNHLIFGRRLQIDNVNDNRKPEDISPGKRKSNLNNLLRNFWNIWRKDYLTSLREYQKLTKKKKAC